MTIIRTDLLIELLSDAIRERKTVRIAYDGPALPDSERVGHPHALFVAGTDEVHLHLWQTGGGSSSGADRLPGWRALRLDRIHGVFVEDLPAPFDDAPGFNPASAMYAKVIAQIGGAS